MFEEVEVLKEVGGKPSEETQVLEKTSGTFLIIFNHRLGFEEYLCKYDRTENKEKLDRLRKWARDEENLKKSSENETACGSKSRGRGKNSSNSRDRQRVHDRNKNKKEEYTTRELSPTQENKSLSVSDDDELLDELLNPSSVEAKDEPIEIENNTSEVAEENKEGQLKNSSITINLVDETNTSEPDEIIGKSSNKPPKKQTAKDKKRNETEYSGDKEYAKPPMSPELLIAIAVFNLDPDRNAGASCTDIVAFLSIHFPYFSQHYQECKVM